MRSSARTREKEIPSGWKQNGGIAPTEMPPLEKTKSV
jgi:hypothetical protein